MKKVQNVLLFRCEKKAEKKDPKALSVPRRLRTYLLPDDFLASRGLKFGDEVRILCGVLIEQGQLAMLETTEHLVFIGYIKVNADESADLYGPDDFAPRLSYDKGEYDIIGPVDKTLSALTEEQTQLEPASRVALIKRYSHNSLGD